MPPLLLALAGVVILAWWLPNRLQDPEPGGHDTHFNSLSYEGYRPGESPIAERFPTAAEVDQDLTLLAPVTRAIRTYSAIEGPYDIPAIAQRHGLRVWQGIWLGGNRAENARQMARAIEMAHRYPDTIERVVVGNEVLLRRDLPPAELIADIDHVKSLVAQKVAYADVSDFWDQFPQVAGHVDVVMVHLLPFWEDLPTGIDHAVDSVGAVYRHFTTLFPGRQIAIGETGWPGRGRQRQSALPSRINQARFLRGFMRLAAAQHFDYNFIEAFDQDWKYRDEGIVGANWGLWGADRTQKIPPDGPLREDPRWLLHAAISVVAGLGLAGLGLAVRHRNAGARDAGSAATGVPTAAQTALLGMTLGAALGLAEAGTVPVAYDVHAAIAGTVDLAGQLGLAVLMMLRAGGAIAPAAWRSGADATRRIRQLLRLRLPLRIGAWGGVFEDVAFLFAWAAGVDQLLLVFDPRYREFPLCTYAVPLVVVVARTARGELPRGIGRREEMLLAFTLTAGAVASAVQEGASNGQSLRWNACALVLAWPLWVGLSKARK